MIGVLFATQREAAPFLELVGAGPLADEALPAYRFTLKTASASVRGIVVIAGIGPGPAAAAAESLVLTHRADWVVNAGICGATSAGMDVGEIFQVSEAREISGAEAPVAGECLKTGVYSPWRERPAARLVTCREPVFDAARREVLGRWGELIDMEGAAVARGCRRRGIPCHMIKAVSDHADTDGREQLAANIDALSAALAEVLVQGLQGWAATRPGLLRRVARLIKVEHTLLSLPLIFAGAWLGANLTWPPMRSLLLIAMAGVGARTLGMAMNRIIDRQLDALNPRTAARDLPKGNLSTRQAYGVAVGGGALFLVACLLLGRVCLLLAPVLLIPLLGYSYLKRFTCLCHFGIGVCLGLGPLAAYVAVSGGLDVRADVLWLALFAFCWVSAFDIIYSLQDLESDRKTGVHSLPVRLGSGGAQIAGACVHAVALAAAAGLAATTGGTWLSWACVAAVGVGLGLAYAPWLPLATRFFPLSAIVGFAGALIPFVGVAA